MLLDNPVEMNLEIKDGKKFFIEQILENERFPTDDKVINKEQQKMSLEMKTVGCFNMGNTCYLNAVTQCVVNTHYFKDYFLRSLFEAKKDIIMQSIQHADLQMIF